MTAPEIILPPQATSGVLLHSLVFDEVLASKKPVSDRCGYLVAGPDRRGANALPTAKLWRLWQRDVQAAGDRAPVKVRDYFERTKGLTAPPKGGDLNVYGTSPSLIQEALIFDDLPPERFDPQLKAILDRCHEPQGGTMLDLGIDLETITFPGGETHDPTVVTLAPVPQGPCQGKLANPPRFATSFSGMESFQQCPFKWAAEKYYKTVPYEESEAAKWGNRVHKTAENYVLNKLDGGSRPVEVDCLPLVKRYCDFFTSMGAEIHVEKEMCCTKDLKPCGWKDWNTVWFRGKGDLLIIKDRKLIIPDWKTGKKKEDYFQIEVMVALADIWFGDKWDTADGKLIFVKETDPTKAVVGLPKPIGKADIPAIWEKIFAITNRMEQACETANFRMQTSGLCKQHCGNLHCVHNGRRSP